MTEVGFEYALQAMSGVAESLHAAGFDSGVPSHEPRAGGGPGRDAPGRGAGCRAPGVGTDAAGEVALDLRGFAAPEPMVLALAAADALPSGGTLTVLTPMVPTPLLKMLAARGLAAHAQRRPDGSACVTIRRPRADESAVSTDDDDQTGP